MRLYEAGLGDADNYFADEDLRRVQGHSCDRITVLDIVIRVGGEANDMSTENKIQHYEEALADFKQRHELEEFTEQQYRMAEECITKRIDELRGKFKMLDR